MADEVECNGWSNEETWSLYTWLSNDEWSNNEIKRKLRTTKYGIGIDRVLEKLVKDLRREAIFEPMFADIGDIHRVNWKELVEALKEEEWKEI